LGLAFIRHFALGRGEAGGLPRYFKPWHDSRVRRLHLLTHWSWSKCS